MTSIKQFSFLIAQREYIDGSFRFEKFSLDEKTPREKSY